MSTTPNADGLSLEQIEEASRAARDILRRRVEQIDQARAEQPECLAKARDAAEEARGWALIEEPWDDHVTAIPACNADGQRTGNALTLPSITAKELWGARLAFDLLGCGDDFDAVDDVIGRMFTMVHGDTGLAMILMSSALSTIVTLIVPQLLQEIEHSGSNWDERVRLCEARAKAWNARLSEYPTEQEAAEHRVAPIGGYDIASAALDDEADDDD